ncbi:hypothetical protein [Clostridium sp. BJN0013]
MSKNKKKVAQEVPVHEQPQKVIKVLIDGKVIARIVTNHDTSEVLEE